MKVIICKVTYDLNVCGLPAWNKAVQDSWTPKRGININEELPQYPDAL